MDSPLKWILAAVQMLVRWLMRHGNVNTLLLLGVLSFGLFPYYPHWLWAMIDDRSCALRELPRIEWAIGEEDRQHFEQELRRLYVELKRCGLETPMLNPVTVDHAEYNNTWRGFHLTFLKVLHRQLAYGDLDVDQWNADVERENAERVQGVARQ